MKKREGIKEGRNFERQNDFVLYTIFTKKYIAEYSIRKSPVPTHSTRACFHTLIPF
jgi:hypothetical protein